MFLSTFQLNHLSKWNSTFFQISKIVYDWFCAKLLNNFFFNVHNQRVREKIILHFAAKPSFDNIHGWKWSFSSCSRNWKSKHKFNHSKNKLVDCWSSSLYQPLTQIRNSWQFLKVWMSNYIILIMVKLHSQLHFLIFCEVLRIKIVYQLANIIASKRFMCVSRDPKLS